MTHEQFANGPDELVLRECKVAHQVLVTMLLDHRRVSKDDLSQLCARRWNVELGLRNLKTTTGMNVLRCQTPQMNDKQLWVHLLALNVIRLLMAPAASNAGYAQPELQAHRATVDAVDGVRSVRHTPQWATVRADRAMLGWSSARSH